ncbi:MAG: hypothetical protein U0X91_07540 [Spirosomataceae bacterium]
MSKLLLVKYLNYPSYIALKEKKGYFATYNGIEYFVAVHEHSIPLEITDYNNGFVIFNDNNEKIQVKLKKNCEEIREKNFHIQFDNLNAVINYDEINSTVFRERHYTLLSFLIECDEEFTYEVVNSKFSSIILHFISTYRSITKDYNTPLPTQLIHDVLIEKEQIIAYSEEDLALTKQERMIKSRSLNLGIKSIGIPKMIGYKTSGWDLEKNSDALKAFFNEKKEVSFVDELYIKASEEFYINKNFKYVILELFTLIEVATVDKLTAFKLKRGISKTKVDEYKKIVPISYLINIEIPLLIGKTDSEQLQVLGSVNRVRQLRNEIIHENGKVREQDAKLALETIPKFLSLLDSLS